MSNTGVTPSHSSATCVLGSGCKNDKETTQPGRTLCGWCQFIAIPKLKEIAKDVDPSGQNGILQEVEDYETYLKEQSKKKAKMCAILEPAYERENWRQDFHPGDDKRCDAVELRNRLCKRCYEFLNKQNFPWKKTKFHKNVRGYPCIWGDEDFLIGANYPGKPWYDQPNKTFWSPPEEEKVGELWCENTAPDKGGLCLTGFQHANPARCRDRMRSNHPNGYDHYFHEGRLMKKHWPEGLNYDEYH
ncbi:hypothetical protein BS50DRAFT_593146 [Corynespora cassiicola Philippines]|uniref:Uncharacterized protein n=1 Tax=Corynespora cassiicola Philippines TaxID=1448308 RepID=A0A2T2N745_CORCC|nr:hypothetical protein BS50DRAFT_593146 [Corynespora cassiicola Philippines]